MMQAEFGRRLDALVHEHYRSGARFVEAVNVAGGKISDIHLSRIMRGLNAPPVEQLALWARLLKLKGDEAHDFRVAGELAQLPQASVVAKDLRETDAIVDRLTKEIETLRAEVATLRAAIATRGAPNPPDRA